jgi:ribosomal protein S18 acetylase RimI-like enzyme
MKLELDYKMDIRADSKLDMVNEFMFYDDGMLIGYLGICGFGDKSIEVNGMVHPDCRRNGIFRNLFSVAADERNRRKTREMLLLCDRNSSSGNGFIRSLKAEKDHSEYDMHLDKNAVIKSQGLNIALRLATPKDAAEIAMQDSIYFGSPINEDDDYISENIANHSTYVALIENKIIGKIRLDEKGKSGGIYGFGVLPEYRGKGYGRDILNLAVKNLRDRNLDDIFLQVETENAKALNLYKSCGFVEKYVMDYYRFINQ